MTNPSPIRKVFEGTVARQQMFSLFDRHSARPWCGDNASSLYSGEWFEIAEPEHSYMFEILPPLWIRGSMFAMHEFLTGEVASVLFALRIDRSLRHFHGYCDLSDVGSVEAMRQAIIERESRPMRAMTRNERLEHIWSTTAQPYRGYAGEPWPETMRGQRTIMLFVGTVGTCVKLLSDLTDEEILRKLPVQLRHLPLPIAA